MKKTQLQKLLFLFTREQETPSYHFLPYKYGCYSFQADQDAKTLAHHYGMLRIEGEGYRLDRDNTREEHLALREEDIESMERLFRQYGRLCLEELIRKVYEQHPWYAINSKILDEPRYRRLSPVVQKEKEKERIRTSSNNRPVLYTTGYEGKSIDHYVNDLIRKDISMLIDVRHNPSSMKYGFSQVRLQYIVEECEIKYRHMRSLGIEGRHRKHLHSQADYDRLFTQYRGSLSQKEKELQSVQEMLNKHRRVALLCFEKDHNMCHRGVLAKELHARHGISIEHL